VAGGLGAALGKTARLLTSPYRLVHGLVSRRWPSAPRAVVPLGLDAAELAADEGLAKLAAALSNPDPTSRMLALEVICEFSEERAARMISSMLHDPDPRVRCAAAAAAARVGSTGTVFSLLSALEDEHSVVVSAASEAIEAITGRSVRLADASASARRDELDKLKRWWKEQRVVELASEFDETP